MAYGRNNKSNQGRGGNGGRQQQKGGRKFKQNDYNMLTFGIGFFDEDGKYPKVRILLKSEEASKPPMDEYGNGFTREEAASLVYQALLEGRGISLYLFENDNGGMSGNARIDITGLEPALVGKTKPAKAKPSPKKPVYQEPEEDEEDYEEAEEELEDSPY